MEQLQAILKKGREEGIEVGVFDVAGRGLSET